MISEHKEQVEFFGQARAYLRSVGKSSWRKLLWATPNGGKRDMRTASALKAEGVQKGVPDITFSVPRGEYHGLYIEMKTREGGRVSPEQQEKLDLLNKEGYKAVFTKGCDEAMRVFRDYVGRVI